MSSVLKKADKLNLSLSLSPVDDKMGGEGETEETGFATKEMATEEMATGEAIEEEEIDMEGGAHEQSCKVLSPIAINYSYGFVGDGFSLQIELHHLKFP